MILLNNLRNSYKQEIIFKVIKTANFNVLKKNNVPGAVSIDLKPSNFKQLKFEYKALAPNYKLIQSLKKNIITEEKFTSQYKLQLNELNPKNVYEHLRFLTGEFEPVLMCHGPSTKFCYRHFVADWFEENLNLKIQEFNKPNYKRKKGYLVKINEPSLFNQDENKIG